MEMVVEGRHFPITEAMQRHIEEKLGKIEKVFDGIHRMHVILAIEKTKRQTVELVCTVAKRHTLFAKGEAEDMYVAIDKAEKKMLAEMKKMKAKLHPKLRSDKAERVLNATAAVADEDEGEE